ncbi:regulator of chromosome condensation (RCC1) repeat domain-containing protein [Hirsutella rhossiliensis]|uniref:Regulator of chromosome condensation (RCC1) repeat domain-containing protein n=1 Tax=Hirsutella rhossiliensis TaxID=111463 RepID=A0A9P8MQ62_9HYPO|nr:regulator of chromosome condensation (RCC1) repeat domain-containing protein [Hirsutella rhossiliensis]KAH0959723.1 regulator of chromosome condensation (RCC1) repeat domain-containing protein [Hirsutella rhossiliensis]
MNSSQKALRRAAQIGCSAQRPVVASQRQWARHASNSTQKRGPRRGGKVVGFAAVFAAAAAGAYYYPQLSGQPAPEPDQAERAAPELEFEKPRKQAVSKEDNRDLISSQHLQVKNSWEHPGVYAWGSNVGKVIDPNSNDKYVKLPRRIGFFDDQLLRDLKLTREFGAAITENGDLVQWGSGFSKADPRPEATLRGKDLVKLEVSADHVIALSRKGAVYSIPASRDDQQEGVKQEKSKSSWSLWSSGGKEPISFRNLTPTKLTRGEKVTDISSGLEHCLLLTNRGRVFSAASSATSFPAKGQMGIPGLGWETRPAGPYDQAHEVATLGGFDIDKIATGDFHSVVSDKAGRVFTFGDNTFGQLGFEAEVSLPFVSTPSMVSTNKLYGNSGLVPKVTAIAAGGVNTFFTVDAEAPGTGRGVLSAAPAKRMPRTVSDLWACGQGVSGTLGTGKWTHVSLGPAKVKTLSSLFEFDEKTNRMMPIKLKSLSIGSTHCSAVMDNVTETNISKQSSENETNWGADVVFWGGNEHYQLGTGKRTNMNTPTYIGPLDGGSGDADKGRGGEVHRLCLTPRSTARVGEGGMGRKVTLEQKVECGKFVTGVYSAV